MNDDLEVKFLMSSRWEPGKECINICDIHMPPYYFKGGRAEWVDELATFGFLYPKEWRIIQEEYKDYLSGNGMSAKNSEFLYYRTDEGDLRRMWEREIFLCISVSDAMLDLRALGDWFLSTELMDFDIYDKYCTLSDNDRQAVIQGIGHEVHMYVEETLGRLDCSVQLTFKSDYSESCFQGTELFIDILNKEYIVL